MKRARSTQEKGSARFQRAASGILPDAPDVVGATGSANPPASREPGWLRQDAEAGTLEACAPLSSADTRGVKSRTTNKTAAHEARGDTHPSRLRSANAPADRGCLDPESAIERETEVIVPLWVAEYIVREASAWLGAELPEDWPAALAAKAERCFARHRQFHRLICSKADGGDAGIANLRKFMRHWTCSWLKRTRLSLYRRLPWDYALGNALRTLPTCLPGKRKNLPERL